MDLHSFYVLDKPEYFLRPTQIFRRISRIGRPAPEFAETVLPWGLPLRYRPKDILGLAVWNGGVFDLSVGESIWRLLDAGENALDIGANIGYMTGIMASRLGNGGTVHAFEPHPEILGELSHNVGSWLGHKDLAHIDLNSFALSDKKGKAELLLFDEFSYNRGSATLSGAEDDAVPTTRFTVVTKRLDDLYSDGESFGLMKIDVEGHELSVLRGGERLFSEHRIRDVVFEEHPPPPTPVTEFFCDHGYTVFFIEKGFFGINVYPLDKLPPRSRYFTPNYIATTDPNRALARLSKKGWATLGFLDPAN